MEDEECSSGRRGLAIQLNLPMEQRVKATVESPWLMVAAEDTSGLLNACGIEETGAMGCLVFEREEELGLPYLYVFTEDPGTEPRNVWFELVDETASCP